MPVFQQQQLITVIGAGPVGTTLAVLLRRAGYRIVSVISKKETSARLLAQLVHCKQHSRFLADIHPSTCILLISAPEEAIELIAEEVAGNATLDFARLIVFHTSGMVTSDALNPLRTNGAVVFSLHPIQSFPKSANLQDQIVRMKDIFYGFEGERKAILPARRLVKAFGGTIVQIPKEEKILYHIACVVASNYSVALLGAVETLTNHVGKDFKLRHVVPLVNGSIENAFKLTPGKALTGPIVRGSISVVEKHVRKLRKMEKRMTELYQHLGIQALEMAKTKKSLDPKIAQQLKKILGKPIHPKCKG
jgi:predicted short-subunit dehydrogenase-like oxidoreductase (DUF2520 family)